MAYMGMPGVGQPNAAPINPSVDNNNLGEWGTNDGSKFVNGVLQPTGTQGGGTVPHQDLYAKYGEAIAGRGYADTYSRNAQAIGNLAQHVFDPAGPTTRSGAMLGGTNMFDGRGREYNGPWINTFDKSAETGYQGPNYRYQNADGTEDLHFRYNQMLMTTAEAFDPFIQRDELENPHWWINRIPRRAFKLFNGLVHETNVFRGGLTVYSGLGDWEPLQADPRVKDPCGPMKFRTYDYAWEKMAWSGMKTAWGSDPFCLDEFKFIPGAIEQLGWIIEQGARFGIDIQNIWNRDNYIRFSVQAGRSYVMSKDYRGTSSPRYVYEPYCKILPDGSVTTPESLKAKASYVDGKPFIVIDASVEMEPVNFEALQVLRRELERATPDAAVTTIGGSKAYGIGITSDDVDKYIRGNEEERRYYIEGNPAALIRGFDIAPNTFRKWVVMEDGDQLRFRIKKYISSYTDAEAAPYGYVGLRELEGKPVFIAVAVDPVRAGRPGINGAPIPEPNPDYDLAEVAIAPVFINNVYTNEFVPSCPGIGHETYFGVVGGLNGTWKWYNIQTEQNPDQKVGNFRGLFEIVPKPEKRAVYATSFVYRRCAQPLKSLCPAENAKINPSADPTITSAEIASGIAVGSVAEALLKTDLVLKSGDEVTVTFTTAVTGATRVSRTGEALTMTSDDPAGTDITKWTTTYGGVSYRVNVDPDDKAKGEIAYFAYPGRDLTAVDSSDVPIPGAEKLHVHYIADINANTAYDAMIYDSPTMRVKRVQFTGSTVPADGVLLAGATLAKA